MDMFFNFAYFVAKKLHIAPSEILDEWSVPELIVTFGIYANEDTRKVYEEWKNLDSKQRQKMTRPREYAVYFRGVI